MFDQQDPAYRHAVLPFDVPALAVEAGVTAGWRKYVGRRGEVVGIDTFGESAPAGELYRHFGLTAARVADSARKLIAQASATGRNDFSGARSAAPRRRAIPIHG